MSIAVSYNGNTYNIPEYYDDAWAQGTGNLTQYLVALASSFAAWSGDITLITPGAGLILTDAVDGHTYRILMYNGNISKQLVT